MLLADPPSVAPLDLSPLLTAAWSALVDLLPAWRRGDASAVGAAARRLIGLGPGQTPSGDDLLAGLIVASRRLIPADGAYLLPAVFDHVAPSMRIAREEVFGPVVGIIPFDTDEEALRIANASPYGLSGSIWSRDIGRALRAAKALKSGVVSVNCNNSVHVEAPFGGYKQSGIGKDLGTEALEQYTELKNVFIDLG